MMKRLQEERLRRRWSRAELARRARLNAVTVGLIEAGRLVPYPSQVRKLARVFGITEDELLDAGGGGCGDALDGQS